MRKTNKWIFTVVLSLLVPVSLAGDGVVVFEHRGFRGHGEIFHDAVANFRHTRLGNDVASSIKVPRGYEVVLYQHKNFRGEAVVLRRSISDLSRTRIGNNRVSSMEVFYRGTNRNRRADGVVLYSRHDFRGNREAIYEDVADLRYSPFGQDRLSSIHIPAHCEVVLYEHTRYRGRSIRLRRSHADLGHSWFGRNRASSLRIVWSEGYGDRGRDYGRGRPYRAERVVEPYDDYEKKAVLLFEHRGFNGVCEAVYGNIPRLRRSKLGNDALSSLRVPYGFEVVLYEHDGYRGRSQVFSGDIVDLSRTRFGNDRASSLQIRRSRHY